MSSNPFEEAKAAFTEGLACYEAGRFVEAERHFQRSLALLPKRVSTLVNLAATQHKLSRPQDALATADAVLAIERDNADALLHRANALLELGRLQPALDVFERLLTLQPTLGPAWSSRGDVLRELDRFDEARHAYRQALAHGADSDLINYYLSALDGAVVPAPPRAYVERLFDSYAGEFEQHVLQVLHYRAHEVLARPLTALHPARFRSALDLGCGTGLCGPLLKQLADRVVGVDLSAAMLEEARSRAVYDHLVHADVTDHLRATRERHDLVLAADVFIYVGDLAPVFEAARDVIEPGGLFCFSAEASHHEGAGFELLPSLRYAHSEAYVRGLADGHGFAVRDLRHEPIREEQRRAIDGMFVYLQREP